MVMFNPYKITGNTIGIGLEGGYDIELFSNFLVGFQASFLAGGINKVKVDDGHTVQTINLEKGSYESLYRIDFSISLRFKIKLLCLTGLKLSRDNEFASL
jgi:hypothetical protein